MDDVLSNFVWNSKIKNNGLKPKYDFRPSILEMGKYVTLSVIKFFKYSGGGTPGDYMHVTFNASK